MTSDDQTRYPKNPRQNANVISLLTFWWIRKIFHVGYKKSLEETDLYAPLKQDRAKYLGQKIATAWEKEVECCSKRINSKPRLLRVLCRCFGKPYIIIGIAEAFMELFSRMYQPLLLATLLRYFATERDEWTEEVYYYAAGLILLPILDAFIMHYTIHCTMHIGLKIKVACTALIYRKILRLSNSVLDNETSVGQMVNFLSNDISRLEMSLWDLHYLWIAPIQVTLVTYFVFAEVGWAAIIGMAVLLLFIPIQGFIAKKMAPLTMKSAERSDNRLRLMNQIIAGVQVIKMYVWEAPFSKLVEQARKREMNVIRKYSILKQLAISFDCYVPRLCLFVTVLAYVLLGNYINAEKVYLVTAYYNILRNSVVFGFSMGLQQLVQGLVCIRRLQKFMTHAEVSRAGSPCEGEKDEFALRLTNVSARWHGDGKRDTLSDISLTVRAGSLVAIVGQVGAGKSSLLHVILRELPLISGSVEVRGKMNYVSQKPWIFAASVRQNILLGQAMDEWRYERAIKVCQMRSDIESFPRSDRTMVGERGMNLSGGQRTRINLARTIYKDADIYLLDDPLSAVDPHVSRQLVDECICGYLKGKTRILVTHQLQYLQLADQIVVMRNGRVEQKGTFDQLQALGLDFMKLLEAIDAECKETSARYSVARQRSGIDEIKTDAEMEDETPVEMREATVKGGMSRKVFLAYFKSSNRPLMILLMMLIFVANQLISGGSDYFVAFWVNVESSSWHDVDNRTAEFSWNGPLSRDHIIYIYSATILVIVFLWQFETIIYFNVCMWSSVNLHSAMFRSILRATMYFYSTNPAGRILNRFARDISIVDLTLSTCIFDIIVIGLILITVVVIVIAVNPWLAIPTAICGCIFAFFRMIYIRTSRCIKRLEGTTRSPIFDHLGASLQGLTTIRAFHAEEILTSKLNVYQDVNASACFLFISTSRAFGFYIDLVCQLYIGTIITAFTFFDLAVVGNVGLTISQIMSLTNILQWGIRQTAELESQMTSIERILEYSTLPEERMIDGGPEVAPASGWPADGRVEFRNVSLAYGPSPYALKDVSFVAMPREKIGIVGRTGAGKSSLINALFRLADVDGEIRLDGVSTGSIGLHDFRSRISIIPQEPFLFSGTLRRNLDPFDRYPDSVLWQALQDVELKRAVCDMAAGLDSRVSDEGANFSVGQRQLLCLARAIVKDNRIMVLDEATANIDTYTDSLIQRTVRTKFLNCTVFTIAHRLNTVMDNDRIFVMHAGRLVEADHPHLLLRRKGHFYHMVQQTGAAMAKNLTDIAAKSYREKNI